jgi:hypothetical protein
MRFEGADKKERIENDFYFAVRKIAEKGGKYTPKTG